jgi:VWFA-related protein
MLDAPLDLFRHAARAAGSACGRPSAPAALAAARSAVTPRRRGVLPHVIACALLVPMMAAPISASAQQPSGAIAGQSGPQPQQQDPTPPPQRPSQQPQQPPQPDTPQPVFRTRVNLVRVDVSVFDRDGKPVEGLGPEDFVVREDGVLQTVATVQFVKLDGQVPPGYSESTAIRSSEHAAVEAAREDVRLFVLFLDDYHIDKSPTVMIPLRRTLRAFVEMLGPFDLVAVMDPLTPLSHVEFTRDRNRLLEIINKFEGRRGQVFPVRSAAEEAQLSRGNVWELRGGVTLDALNAIVTKLGGLREGRKSVLFVSQGPPVTLRSSNWMRLEEVVQSANRANVTIHTLDPRPLGAAGFGNFVLRRLSDETGGRAIFNTNDHASHLGGIIEDASAYYLVGYTPTRGEIADGKYHEIEVEVKRPRVRVVARRGYWAPRAEDLTARRPEPLDEGVRDALTRVVEPRTGSTAEVWVGFSRNHASGTTMTVSWAPMTAARAGAAPATLEVERLTATGAPMGEPLVLDERRPGEPPASASIEMPPGPAILRFTARDGERRVLDQWHETITVPAFTGDELALATPRFLIARSPFELRAIRNNPDAPPSATRRVRKSDRLLVEIEAYAPGGPPELTLELLNQSGERLVSLPVPQPASGRPRVEIPVQSLAPATYIVKITAAAGDQQVDAHASFVIVP